MKHNAAVPAPDPSSPNPEARYLCPEDRCTAAVRRLVLDDGVSLGEVDPPEHLDFRLLGDRVFVVLTEDDGAVYGPFPDLEEACRAAVQVRLETPAGIVLDWSAGPHGNVLTLSADGEPRVALADEWAMEVPTVIFTVEGDACRPGGGWIISVSEWGGRYWVQGDGMRRQLPEDHHPTLESAWAAYMGDASIPQGTWVRAKELTARDVAARFTLYQGSTCANEGVVTVNGEEVVLRVAGPVP